MCHILILKVCKRDHLNFAILRCCFQAIGRKSRSVNIFFHSDQTWQFHFCQLTYIDEILSDSNKIFIYISDFTNPCCTWDSKVLCHGRSYLSSVTVRSLLSTNDHVIITNGCNSLSQCIGGCQHVRTCESTVCKYIRLIHTHHISFFHHRLSLWRPHRYCGYGSPAALFQTHRSL